MRDRRLNRLYLHFRDRGDTRALGVLFDALSPELLRVARHLARDRAEAEDLLQATFLTLIEHPERYDASRPLTAWAAGVLTKHARAWGRNAARRVEPERALEEPLAREARERPELRAAASEETSLVRDALERLPARYREVVGAHLVQHKSPAEIARERGGSATRPMNRTVPLASSRIRNSKGRSARISRGSVTALPARRLFPLCPAGSPRRAGTDRPVPVRGSARPRRRSRG